jgi:hypothetical protein
MIAIHSSWRGTIWAPPMMRQPLGHLGARSQGMTSAKLPSEQSIRDFDVTPVRFTASKLPREAVGFKRHAECMDWLRRRRAAETRWIAIDDQPWLWAPRCPHLLLIDGNVGLPAGDAQELLARLVKARTA